MRDQSKTGRDVLARDTNRLERELIRPEQTSRRAFLKAGAGLAAGGAAAQALPSAAVAQDTAGSMRS